MGKASRKRRVTREQKAKLVAAIPYGMHPSEDAASSLDRRWFEEHPGVEVRIRRRLPGELDPLLSNDNPFVVVRQLRPGVRTRNTTNIPPADAGIVLFDGDTEIEEWQISREDL